MKSSIKFGGDFSYFSKQNQQIDVSKGWIRMHNHLQTQTMKVSRKTYLEMLYWKSQSVPNFKLSKYCLGQHTTAGPLSPFVAATKAEDQTYTSFWTLLILKRIMLLSNPSQEVLINSPLLSLAWSVFPPLSFYSPDCSIECAFYNTQM